VAQDFTGGNDDSLFWQPGNGNTNLTYKGVYKDDWNLGVSGPKYTGVSNTTFGNSTFTYQYVHP
jgi:hypothetical protein